MIPKKIGIKAAILGPLAFLILTLCAAFTFSFRNLDNKLSIEDDERAFQSAQRVYDSAVQSEAEKLSIALGFILQDKALRQAMQAHDRETLLRLATPVFEKLRKENNVTHFYFYNPDRINLLRVHQPDRHGDLINRITARQAEASGKPASGLELGPLGTFTLRVVHPWFDGKKLIGYVELGEEIEHSMDRIRTISGVDLYVAIDKQHLSRQNWETGMKMLGRSADWNMLPNAIITLQTNPALIAPMRAIFARAPHHAPKTVEVFLGDGHFHAKSLPLLDAGNNDVGDILFLRDNTARLASTQRHTLEIASLALAFGGLLFGLFYLVTRRVENRLAASASALRESEVRFRSLVESSTDFIWEIDRDSRYVYASPKIQDILGYDPHEILGRTPFDLMPPPEAERVANAFAAIAATRKPFSALENVNLNKNGGRVVLETSGVPVFNEDGTLRGYRGIDRDITDRKRAEESLRQSTQRLTLNFQQSPLAMIEWDTAFRVVDWNPAAEAIFGYSKADAVGRYALSLVVPASAKSHVDDIWSAILQSSGGSHSTNENITKDGRLIFCEWYNTPLVDQNGQVIGVSSLAQDITAHRQAEQRLNYLAYYDDLTGLPNRALFKDHLTQAMINASRHERLVGVAFIDLDHFKIVNDTLGHEAGDLLLQMVAARLQQALRESDTVARFGGDEFAVVMADMAHVQDAGFVAQKVLDSFNEPFQVHGHELFVSPSLGITIFPFDDDDVESLLRNADSAMYHAKKQGRANYQFYSAEMTTRVQARLLLENRLRHALERNEFILYYQPQMDLASGRIVSAEALIRWQHPEKGLISPTEFIPVAEETGLIVAIGEWVLHTACMQAKAWRDGGSASIKVAVNLSSRQFKQDHLIKTVTKVLDATGLDANLLELEITESILLDNAASVRTTFEAFKRAGITIAIDDFGTGYSSLSYLKSFPIDKLKIDQSFVRDLSADTNDASLVRAIIAIARSLRLKTIAEGVETQEQLDFLRTEGCEEVQGYLVGHPMPADSLTALIKNANVYNNL